MVLVFLLVKQLMVQQWQLEHLYHQHLQVRWDLDQQYQHRQHHRHRHRHQFQNQLNDQILQDYPAMGTWEDYFLNHQDHHQDHHWIHRHHRIHRLHRFLQANTLLLHHQWR